MKNRIRILKAPLAQEENVNNCSHEEYENIQGYVQAAQIILACSVLHNMFCDPHDETDLEEEDVDSDEAADYDIEVFPVPENAGKTRRGAIRHCLSSM